MKRNHAKTVITGLILVLVLSLGAVAVFAQDDAEPEPEAQPALPGGRGWHGFHGRGDLRGGDEEALAEALGISVEQLQAARQQIFADRLAQAVEDGDLTQDEANTMLAIQALRSYTDKEAIMAQVLGLTVEELQAAGEDGSLYDLLANITPADLQARMQEATEAAVNQAVADNVITQEQADLVLEQLQNMPVPGGRFGGHRGFHGFRGAAPQGLEDDAGGVVAPFGA